MFNNFKLRERILLGYSIPSLLIIIFSVVVYSTASQTKETFKEVNTSENAIIETDDMVLRISLMARQVRGYLLVKSPEAINLFNKEKKHFDEDVQRAEKLIEEPEQKERFRKMLQLTEQFDNLALITFRGEDEGKKHNEVVNHYLKESNLTLKELDDVNEEFSQKQQEMLGKNTQSTTNNIELITFASIAISILSLAVSLGAAYLITQPLVTRIGGVVKVAERISEGDLTESVEIASNNKDEVGQLLNAFRAMSQNLNSLIRQVQQSGIQSTTTATQIASSNKQLEAMVTEQLASTNQVAATTKEIAATSFELVKTVDKVSSMMQETTIAAFRGQKDLQTMEVTMSQLAKATSYISNKLGVISEKTNNINSVVTTITKVADQTNLLSINAAIEAEKAGEYGLGFAVVAREIRRLADQTAVATLDIEQMIKEMQSAVSTGVMEMDKFTVEVGGSIDSVGAISRQIGQIIEQVKALTPQFEAVNQGIEVQSQGAGQISQATIQLSEAASQTASSVRETNRAIEQWNSTAQDLRREVSRFKVRKEN